MPRQKIDLTKIVDRTVSATEMAEVLGLTTRRLTQLVDEGAVKKEGRGAYHLAETVQSYIRFVKEGVTQKSGTASLDKLRDEKALEIQLNRLRKDRQLIDLEEALGFIDEVVGLFVSSLNGLPAQITGVPRERQRLNEIFDAERQRLADRFAKKRAALRTGDPDTDTEAEDDAS